MYDLQNNYPTFLPYYLVTHISGLTQTANNNSRPSMNISQRLSDLREVMRREHLSACIIPSTDPHQSEYVPDRWKGRQWISGFDGSAGTAVITLTSAALWTDSRYFLAAEQQLAGTEFRLMRLKVEGTPTIAQWLGSELAQVQGAEVAIDGMVASVQQVQSLSAELRHQGGITLRTNVDLLDRVWTDRPALPSEPAFIYPIEYAGEQPAHKLTRIRQALRRLHADGMLVSALDDVAWTLNLRGNDIHCNPVLIAYLLITSQGATLFCSLSKLSGDTTGYLRQQGVDVRPYETVGEALAQYPDYNVLLDPSETSHTLSRRVRVQEVVAQPSPIPAMKAVKNEAEIMGFRRAMLRDGIAMVRFLRWLKPAVEAGGQTEMSVDRKLTSLRAEQPLFHDISFDTIAGYEQHGAIVHYEATPETDAPLSPRGLLLIDSGAQFADGTTDITRTVALGPVTDEQRHIYTLVLKGHIQIELCKFPAGATGTQLDIMARQAMWREGLNYMHGTGHGVGAYLCVHEGPHQIRMEHVPAPLAAGMTVTDEPGLYLPGRFGVRIENTLLIQPYMETEFGRFLQFEPLTLCPIDTAPIDLSLLLPEEREWLNGYHELVYRKLSPHLDADEQAWLAEATRRI